MGRLKIGVNATNSTASAGPRYNGNQLSGAPSTGPTSTATAPRSAMAKTAAISAAPRPIVMRAATAASAAAPAIIIGCSTSRNCSTPKSYSI